MGKDVYSLSERLTNIKNILFIPTLKSHYWCHQYKYIQKMLLLTETVAAFLTKPPINKAITLWSLQCAAKIREVAPNFMTAPRDSLRAILTTVTAMSLASIQVNLINTTDRFWSLQPQKDVSIHVFIKEYQKRFQDLGEHTAITPEVEYQMKYLLLFNITSLQQDLVNHCRDLDQIEIITECIKWSSIVTKLKPSPFHKN